MIKMNLLICCFIDLDLDCGGVMTKGDLFNLLRFGLFEEI